MIIPELNVNEEIFIGEKTINRDIESGLHADKNLLELTVYLTGKCELECDDCDCMYKQIAWCTKNGQILPTEKVFDMLEQTKYTSISDVKFIGGNIFLYPFWDELIEEFKKIFVQKKCIYRLYILTL